MGITALLKVVLLEISDVIMQFISFQVVVSCRLNNHDLILKLVCV